MQRVYLDTQAQTRQQVVVEKLSAIATATVTARPKPVRTLAGLKNIQGIDFSTSPEQQQVLLLDNLITEIKTARGDSVLAGSSPRRVVGTGDCQRLSMLPQCSTDTLSARLAAGCVGPPDSVRPTLALGSVTPPRAARCTHRQGAAREGRECFDLRHGSLRQRRAGALLLL